MPPHDPKPAAIPHDQGSPGAFGLPTHHPIFGSGWAPARSNASPAPRSLTGGRHDLNPAAPTPRLLADRVCGGSSPASRSFVLTALRALHLDPGFGPPTRRRAPGNE